MKRAAILIMAVATLVLIGYPSTPLLADNSIPTVKAKTGSSGVIAPPGGEVGNGSPTGGGTGGGSDEGDADGLSGIRRPPANNALFSAEVGRVMIVIETWWKFMLWLR